MVADFLFGLSLIFIMIILLAAVMSICPKWGFALAGKEVKEAYLWVKKSGWFQRNFVEFKDSDIFDRFQVSARNRS